MQKKKKVIEGKAGRRQVSKDTKKERKQKQKGRGKGTATKEVNL